MYQVSKVRMLHVSSCHFESMCFYMCGNHVSITSLKSHVMSCSNMLPLYILSCPFQYQYSGRYSSDRVLWSWESHPTTRVESRCSERASKNVCHSEASPLNSHYNILYLCSTLPNRLLTWTWAWLNTTISHSSAPKPPDGSIRRGDSAVPMSNVEWLTCSEWSRRSLSQSRRLLKYHKSHCLVVKTYMLMVLDQNFLADLVSSTYCAQIWPG